MTVFNAQVTIASENSLILYFGEDAGAKVSDEISAQIQTVKANLEQAFGDAMVELIPSYASLLVTFDPYKVDHYTIRQLLNSTQPSVQSDNEKQGEGQSTKNNEVVIELPVYYDESVGPDLQRIAQHASLSIEEVVKRHQAQMYRVFAIGFAPGFGYLGQVDETIAMPRLASPRSHVPKGAVAIADRQTAIYPAASPGGWNIIGRCPVDMFTPNKQPAMPFDVGDVVRFKQINKQEFIELGGEL